MKNNALEHISRLIKCSEDYQFPTPFTVFLDLIGWNKTYHFGSIAEPMPFMGVLELRLIADALLEYCQDVASVLKYINNEMSSTQFDLPFDNDVTTDI